jgi:hypothetical protein
VGEGSPGNPGGTRKNEEDKSGPGYLLGRKDLTTETARLWFSFFTMEDEKKF